MSRKNTPENLFVDEVLADAAMREMRSSGRHGRERLEVPLTSNIFRGVFATVIFIVTIFGIRMFELQVLQGHAFAEQSERNHLETTPIFAGRGHILDRNGAVLAWSEFDSDSPFPLREYKKGEWLGTLLGHVDYPRKDSSDNFYSLEYRGLAGVESGFDDTLAGENGREIIEFNAVFDRISSGVLEEPKHGTDITVSINEPLQKALYTHIEDLAEQAGFTGGAGILVDITTGEIHALTSFPGYESSVMTSREPQEKVTQYLTDDRLSLLNRATFGHFTPGSIMKMFIALGALNEDIVDPNDTFVSTGELRVENPYVPGEYSIFKDWRAHGEVNMERALSVSSNVFFYIVGGGYEDQEGLGIDQIERYVRAFGFGDPIGIHGVEEEDSVVPSRTWKEENFEDGIWRLGDTYNSAIGQYGFLVTPIQVVRAIGAVATNGVLTVPTLRTDKAPEYDRVSVSIAPEHYETVRNGMWNAVHEGGTAAALNVEYVDIGAKTGTAELGISKDFVNSWVGGFFPFDDPKYAFVVLMEEGPRTNLVGASSVMRNTLDWMYWNTPEYFE